MKFGWVAALAFAMLASASAGFAQVAAPAPRGGPQAASRPRTVAYQPTAEELAGIKTKLAELNAAITALKAENADDDLVVDAESCAWVVNNITRVPGGFIDQSYVNRCNTLLNDGLRRAGEIKNHTAAWQTIKGRVNRAYRSVVDGTAQPYHLSVPASYDPAKPIPLYVYLHGRSQYDPDLGMGWAGGNDRAAGDNPARGRNAARGGTTADGTTRPADALPEYIRVEAFGRANNSYRWAGEADVLEAIASVCKRYNVDPNRILLAGFSLGGAGSWQTGLHYPDMFCGLEVDAGVIGTRRNLNGLNRAQRATQTTYGIMIDHALNVFDVPLVAYAGANDAQLLSSTSIRQQLVREGYAVEQTSQFVGKGKDINALFLANPGQGHSHATGETARLINEFNAESFKNGRIVPDHIRYVTYTTRYNRDFWVTVDGLDRSFSRSTVDAQRDAAHANYTIETTNISRLSLSDMTSAKSIIVDGDDVPVAAPASSMMLIKNAGVWRNALSSDAAGLTKHHGLQGPVNDAFMSSFICVAPSKAPAPATPAYTHAITELARFEKMFAREYLGDSRIKADSAVTPDDIASSNLILFGDPASNSMIARIADKLPVRWTADSFVVGDKTYSRADHLPVLIYPNPLNPAHYVVLNAGLSAGSFGGSGAAYGDYAVLDASEEGPGIVVQGGVFNESWELAVKP